MSETEFQEHIRKKLKKAREQLEAEGIPLRIRALIEPDEDPPHPAAPGTSTQGAKG